MKHSRKKIIISTVFICSFVIIITYFYKNNQLKTYKKLNLKLKTANNILKSGKIEKALNIYEEILEKYPSYNIPSMLINAGAIYMKKQMFKKAEELFLKVIKIDKKNALAMYNLGLIYLKLKQLKKAKIYLEKAVPLTKFNPEYYFTLALLYKELKKYEKAKSILLEIIEKTPEFHKAHHELGLLYYNIFKDEKAGIKHLKIASTLSPKNHMYLNDIGVFYLRKGDLQLAKTFFKKAEKAGDSMDIHYNLGLIYFKEKKYYIAITEFKNALKFNPCNTEILNDIGYTYYLINEYEKAEFFLKNAYKLSNKDMDIIYNLALLKEAKNDYESAISLYKKCIEIDSSYLPARVNLTRLLIFFKKNYKQVEKLCSSGLLNTPDFPPLLYNRGLAYYFMKDYKAAYNDMLRVLKTGGKNSLSYSAYQFIKNNLKNLKSK